MSEPVWIDAALIVALHDEELAISGGSAGMRDQDMLDSALDRPRNKWAYGEHDLTVLAAAYAFGIARNYPFVDGNKRAAFLAATLFLDLNGVGFEPDQVEAVLVFEGLAAGTVSEAELAEWIGKAIVS
jgi:death on curing protein